MSQQVGPGRTGFQLRGGLLEALLSPARTPTTVLLYFRGFTDFLKPSTDPYVRWAREGCLGCVRTPLSGTVSPYVEWGELPCSGARRGSWSRPGHTAGAGLRPGLPARRPAGERARGGAGRRAARAPARSSGPALRRTAKPFDGWVPPDTTKPLSVLEDFPDKVSRSWGQKSGMASGKQGLWRALVLRPALGQRSGPAPRCSPTPIACLDSGRDGSQLGEARVLTSLKSLH